MGLTDSRVPMGLTDSRVPMYESTMGLNMTERLEEEEVVEEEDEWRRR